jgi:hypothetical protein
LASSTRAARDFAPIKTLAQSQQIASQADLSIMADLSGTGKTSGFPDKPHSDPFNEPA